MGRSIETQRLIDFGTAAPNRKRKKKRSPLMPEEVIEAAVNDFANCAGSARSPFDMFQEGDFLQMIHKP